MSYSVICFGKTIVTNWLKQSIAQYVQSTNSLITLTLMELAKRVPGIGDMQPESSTTISNCSLGTSKKVDIFHHPIIRNMGEYIVRSYAGKGWVVNFADASARGEAKPSLLYAYGKGVDSKLMKEFFFLPSSSNERRTKTDCAHPNRHGYLSRITGIFLACLKY